MNFSLRVDTFPDLRSSGPTGLPNEVPAPQSGRLEPGSQARKQPHERDFAAPEAWLEQAPGSPFPVFQGTSFKGKRVEVYALGPERYECFWDNGEHWFNLPLDSMKALVLSSLQRDCYPNTLGY